jgi:uncharacterized alpha/beta hydrolase family protein
MKMKIKVGIVLTIVLVLCLVGYIISTQTQINADLTKEPEKDSVQVSPEEAGMAEEIDLAGADVPGSSEDKIVDQADHKDSTGEEDELLTASGTFNGRIDNNFIEIELKDGTVRSFQLSEDLRTSFDDYGFDIGDSLRFSYREREGQNPLIERIE